MTTAHKTVGIIGGVGPEATVDLFSRIVKNTPAKRDTDHIRVLIDNNPQIPSRVAAILSGGKSPVPTMRKMAKSLEHAGAEFLAIPCNSASYFINEVRSAVDIPILDIVAETVSYIYTHHLDVKKIGIMGTSATIKSGIYTRNLIHEKVEYLCNDAHCSIINELKEFPMHRYFRYVYVDEEDADNVKHLEIFASSHLSTSVHELALVSPKSDSVTTIMQSAISGKEGIKAGYRDSPRRKCIKIVNELKDAGAEIVIMGCTEIPLVLSQKDVDGVKLINPSEILAQAIVDIALGHRVL